MLDRLAFRRLLTITGYIQFFTGVCQGEASLKRLILLSSVLLGAVPSVASATGILVARFGGEHGHASTSDPTAIYYNPAGLALGRGTRVYAEGLFGYRSLSYDRPEAAIDNIVEPGETEAGTPREAVGANSGKATLGNPVASPFLGVTSDLGVPNLGVGAAIYVPFGGQAIWDDNDEFAGNQDYPGAVDGVNRWHTIEGTIRSVYLTAGGAYRLPGPRLSFGLGLNIVLSEISTVRARNADGSDNLSTSTGGLQEGRSFLDVSGTQLALGAGVIWEPADDVFIGLSYQSQPGFGDMTLEGTLTNKLGTAPTTTQAVEVEQAMPDVIRLAARFRPAKKVEVRVQGEYARWSVFEHQCILDATDATRNCAFLETGELAPGAAGVVGNIPRDWRDGVAVRAGASYYLSPEVELVAGLGFDGNAVPAKTMESSLPDMNNLDLSLGGYFRVGDKLMIAATAMMFTYFETTIAPEDSVMLNPPSRVPSGAGTYNQSIFALLVGVQLAL
jgi:long-chain fatty acid transport protein